MDTRAKAIGAMVVILAVAALIVALEAATAGALPWWGIVAVGIVGLGFGLGFLNDLIGVYRQIAGWMRKPTPPPPAPDPEPEPADDPDPEPPPPAPDPPAPGAYAYDAFISYSHKDSDWVTAHLLPALQKASLRYCLDEEHFQPGVPTVVNMTQGVEQSRVTVAVLTPAYCAGDAILFESVLARGRDLMGSQGRYVAIMAVECFKVLPAWVGALWLLKVRNERERLANLPKLIAFLAKAAEADKPKPDPEATPAGEPWPPPIYAGPPGSLVPAWYVERPEQMGRILKALGATDGAPPPAPNRPVGLTAAVQGLGGVGKTVLAAALLRQPAVRRRWPDGVLWATLGPDADSPADADAHLMLWAHEVGVDLSPYPTTEMRAQILCNNLQGRRLLLVCDDAWHAEPARTLLGCGNPACGKLVTTRDTAVAAALGKPLLVDVLTPDEARALLRKRAGDAVYAALPPEDVDELLKRLGRHALGVDLVAANLAQGAALSDYLAPLRAGQGAIEGLRFDEYRERQRSLNACFGASVARLPDETDRRRFHLLGALAPEAPFGLMEAAVMWEETDAALLRKHLRPLSDAGLIELLQGGEEPRYRQHALLREYALESLPEAERAAALERHSAVYLDIARQLKRQMQWPAFPAILPQATAALERAWRAVGNAPLLPETRDASEHVSDWVAALNEYWDVSGQYMLRIVWLKRSLICDRGLGNRRGESKHLNNLGIAYAVLGETGRAIEHYEHALAVAREMGDRRGEGQHLDNLGIAYAALGEPHKAIEYGEFALAISRDIGDQRLEGSNLNNLGVAYVALGETRKAIEYYELALGIAREIGDRRGEGENLGNLGIAFAALGETRKAMEYYEQELVIVHEIGDRRGEGNALNSLGIAYVALGETRKAIEYHEQQLVIVHEIGDRRGEGNALGNLGIAFAALGETRKAIEYYEQQLVIVHEIGDRRGEGNALGNLGAAYGQLGEIERAIEYLVQQLAIVQAIGDRSGEGNAHLNLGLALKGLGRVEEARAHLQAALELYTAIEHTSQAAKARAQLDKLR